MSSCPPPTGRVASASTAAATSRTTSVASLENYGNSLTCSEPPHLFGGWAQYLYVRRGTPVFKVPEGLPTNVAVLTELFAVTHSLDLVAKMPRPGGFRSGDTVAVVGIGPVGIVHVAKASLLGAAR